MVVLNFEKMVRVLLSYLLSHSSSTTVVEVTIFRQSFLSFAVVLVSFLENLLSVSILATHVLFDISLPFLLTKHFTCQVVLTKLPSFILTICPNHLGYYVSYF